MMSEVRGRVDRGKEALSAPSISTSASNFKFRLGFLRLGTAQQAAQSTHGGDDDDDDDDDDNDGW